jgi:hypothetical protein
LSTPTASPVINALEKIEHAQRETISTIASQTDKLLHPENRLLNLPTDFSVPAYQPFGGGGATVSNRYDVAVNVTVNGPADSGTVATMKRATAEAVADALAQGGRNSARGVRRK